jgi:hypothetical protein
VKTKQNLASTTFLPQKLKKRTFLLDTVLTLHSCKNKLGNACFTNFLENPLELVFLLAQKAVKKLTQKGSENVRHSCGH